MKTSRIHISLHCKAHMYFCFLKAFQSAAGPVQSSSIIAVVFRSLYVNMCSEKWRICYITAAVWGICSQFVYMFVSAVSSGHMPRWTLLKM